MMSQANMLRVAGVTLLCMTVFVAVATVMTPGEPAAALLMAIPALVAGTVGCVEASKVCHIEEEAYLLQKEGAKPAGTRNTFLGVLLKFCAVLLLANGLTGLIMAVMSAAHQHPALEPRNGGRLSVRFLVTMSVLGVINIVCCALFWTVSHSVAKASAIVEKYGHGHGHGHGGHGHEDHHGAEHKDAHHAPQHHQAPQQHGDSSHDFATKGGHSVQAPYRGYSMPNVSQPQQPMQTQGYGMGNGRSYSYDQQAYKCPPGGDVEMAPQTSMSYNSGGGHNMGMGYHTAAPLPTSASMLMQQQPTPGSRGMAPQHQQQQQHMQQYQQQAQQYVQQQQQQMQYQPQPPQQYQQMQGPTSLSYGGSSLSGPSHLSTGPMGHSAAMNSQSGMMGHSGMLGYNQAPLSGSRNTGGGVISGALNVPPSKRGGH